jgi:hypothetical protein
MTARRGHAAPPVGRAARILSLFGAGILAACGETKGLVLGESPELDAGAGVDANALAPPDADAPSDDAAHLDAGSLPVTLSGQSLTTQQGGPPGTTYADTCPGNQAVIGYDGFLTPASVGLILVGGVQAVCGDLYLSGSSDQIATSVGATLPMRGDSQANYWTQMCPANEVVVGFSGRSGADVDQLAFECAPWLAPASSDGSAALTIGTRVTLSPAGGDGGTAFSPVECPPGELARGSNVIAGDWVDEFGLICGTPTL